MLLNKNKILIAGVVGGVALAVPNMAKAQTFYQCMPCGEGTFYYEGKCYKTCPENYIFDTNVKKCRREKCIKQFTMNQLDSKEDRVCLYDIHFDRFEALDRHHQYVYCENFIFMNDIHLNSIINCKELRRYHKCEIELKWSDNPIYYEENGEIKEWRCEEFLEE